MQPRFRRYALLFTFVALTPVVSGCGLLRQSTAARSAGSGTPVQANPGEREGTIPAAAAAQAPSTNPAGSPRQALERFAAGYINWTYRTLAADQLRLAASAVGEARAAELQARAQTARDTPLQRARIYNTGTVVAVSPVIGGAGQEWVVVTREQTGGDEEYAGLQAAFHITLATVARVANRWVVSAWRPQA